MNLEPYLRDARAAVDTMIERVLPAEGDGAERTVRKAMRYAILGCSVECLRHEGWRSVPRLQDNWSSKIGIKSIPATPYLPFSLSPFLLFPSSSHIPILLQESVSYHLTDTQRGC